MIIIKISAKVINRITKEIPRYQRILNKAKSRDVNESDTVMIVTDILSDVFGYDKFNEITSEQAIRGTYCDLAVKLDDKVKYLIEVKAIGINLKENHLRQAVNYGANAGIPWVILTNGINWEFYKINVNRTVSHELVCSFEFTSLTPKVVEDQEKIYLLCRRGVISSAIEDHYLKHKVVNRFMVGAICLQTPVINVIRKQLRQISPNLKVTEEEIKTILSSEVLKREVLEGDSFTNAKTKVKKSSRKSKAKSTKKDTPQKESPKNELTEEPTKDNTPSKIVAS